LLLIACGNGMESTPVDEAATVSVRVVEAETVARAPHFPAAGVLRPYRRVQMGTRQSGTVEAVLVRAGDRVTAGEEILRVDSRDLEASRAAALQQRDAAREVLEQARRNHERFRRLYEQELIAKVRLEEAELEAEHAESALGRAEAQLAAIEINVDYTRLRAPFSGVVSEILTETGSFVGPGMPLVVFEDRDRLEVEAAIDQASAAGMSAGDPLPVAVQGIDQPVEGRLQAVLPALAGTGTGLRLRVMIDDPPAVLVPGMVAELRVPSARDASRRVRVPATAVLRRGQLSGVFVVEAGDDVPWRATLRWIALDPATRDEDWAYVMRGLEAGERVVIGDATSQLADGQAVKLQD
jgi:RND family efflux transporter MFP subunit